jgi:hypothetical protein
MILPGMPAAMQACFAQHAATTKNAKNAAQPNFCAFLPFLGGFMFMSPRLALRRHADCAKRPFPLLSPLLLLFPKEIP